MKKEKGITLIALVITIIILLILASIATYSGISTIRSSKLNKFKQELEIMQAQVQILYEKYKDKDTIDIGKDINSSGRVEEADTAFNGAEETEKSGYRLFDKEEIQKLGIDGIERDYLLDIMRKKVICLQGFEYDGNIYYTLEQLTDKNIISGEITRGDVTFEYTTEELSSGGWKVTVYNIKFSKYVGKGIIQYEDTSTGKITTVEKNAKEGENYEFTINSEGNYEIIVTDVTEKFAKELIELRINEIDITVKITGYIPNQVKINLSSDSGFSQNYEFDAQDEYTITNLPKYSNGEIINYSIVTPLDGRYISEVIKISEYNFVINYTYDIPQETTITKTVVILFDDTGVIGGQRPTSVDVILYRNGVEYNRATLSENNEWKHNFTELSNSYNWTIGLADEIPEGYTTSIQNSGNTTMITFIEDSDIDDEDTPL